MPVSIENRLRRIHVVNLPHEVYCREACACSTTTVVVAAEHPRTGDRVTQHVSRRAASSITWLALERKDGLPDVLLDVPDIQAAIGRGHLRLVQQSAVPTSDARARGNAASPSPPAAPSAPPSKEP